MEKLIGFFVPLLTFTYADSGARHFQPELVKQTVVTTTVGVTAACYEPAETLYICRRKKKQNAILLDPLSFVGGDQTQVNLYTPVSINIPGVLQPQYDEIGALSKALIAQNHPALRHGPSLVDIESSLGQGGSYPGYLQFVDGELKVKTKTVYKTLQVPMFTMTVPLDCLSPGETVPQNICKVTMIFPLPPLYISPNEYCLAMAKLAGAGLAGCTVESTTTGSGIRMEFTKGSYAPYPSRKVVMKNILTNLAKENCNLLIGRCPVPGIPYSMLDIYTIYIDGIQNVRSFILQIIVEIFGTVECAPGSANTNKLCIKT